MRLLTLQLLLAITVANARNDPPPSSDRTWSPPNLPNYERESQRCLDHRRWITCHRGAGLSSRIEREMVVARFRRAQRCRRGGQRAIDDGKRWLQRDSSENRVSGNRTFLSTWDGSPKSSGQPKRIGSCANGGASGG